MKQQKRHQTNLISAVTLVITGAVLIFLGIALYNHAKLEVRFDTLINYLKQIDDSIVKLDSDVEIIICIFALYIAKCQLPIPMGFLCVISGMVFPLAEAVAINIIFTEFFFIVKYLEGKFIGGGWTGMILGIKKISIDICIFMVLCNMISYTQAVDIMSAGESEGACSLLTNGDC